MANGTWKIARNKASAQLPLLIVVVLAVVLVLVGRTQSSLFDRVRADISDMTAPMLASLHAPVLGFERWMGSVNEIFSVYEENLKLKDENARLRQWQNAAVVLQGEVRHYESLLHAVPGRALHSVLARVIGRASRPFLQTMILGAGSVDAVKPGEAVIDARGMVGRVYLTGARTSWVILLTDLNSRVPVSIAPGNIPALLAGDDTARPTLDALTSAAGIKAGDQVISSGDGGLLPPGLPIGVVVADGAGFRVALFADAASSDEVEVLAFRDPPEQMPGASNELPVKAAGLAPLATVPQVPGPQVKDTVAGPAPGKNSAPAAIGGQNEGGGNE